MEVVLPNYMIISAIQWKKFVVRVLLFAGGSATRMYPFSAYTEKSLLPLPNGKPIIRELFERLTAPEQPFMARDITILCQDKHEGAFRHEFRDEDVEYSALQQMGTLKHLREIMRYYNKDSTFVVHYADMITDIGYDRLMAMHTAHGHAATAVLTEVQSPYGSVTTMVDNSNMRIDSFKEKEMLGERVWTGVAVLERAATMPYIEKLCSKVERPDIGKDLMPELTRNKELYAYLHKGVWNDLGNAAQYLKLMENGTASIRTTS